jgi:opacity protein-like surface antigen
MRAIVLFIVISLFLVTSCSSSEDLAAADREVEKFHQAFDAGQFEELYDHSADDFKKASSKGEFLALLNAVRRKLGKTTGSKRTNWTVNFATSGNTVAVIYETSFTSGKGTEQFVYRIAGKKVVLAGYHVTSNDLIIR